MKSGKTILLPTPPKGKMRRRTAREKLLSGDLWAARIERLWKEPNGTYWLKCYWYLIPEETTAGRQPHNLRRELFRSNHVSDIEVARQEVPPSKIDTTEPGGQLGECRIILAEEGAKHRLQKLQLNFPWLINELSQVS
ncbi:hypothetical protein KSP39_PZI001928 [Platanthera zijinensis]|uniref:BAH domain-containing protein n=1 Tax=Platanthera zijinensis TaxID=2320716 RepID=A0AAP0GEZ3_9ASPA